MNTVEGFFGIGSIIGPALLARLLTAGVSWKWLYVIAGTMCVLLVAIALLGQATRSTMQASEEPIDLRRTHGRDEESVRAGLLARSVPLRRHRVRHLCLDADAARGLPRSGGFACRLQHFDFLLPARGGRFVGGWMLQPLFAGRPCSRCSAPRFWPASSAQCRAAPEVAVYLLPISGLFMSVIYPDHQFQGHQLLPEIRARRGLRRDSVLHLRLGGPRAAGHGRGQRCHGRHAVRIHAGHGFRRPAIRGIVAELDLQSHPDVLNQLDHSEYQTAG